MIISIKDVWQRAEAKHKAYVLEKIARATARSGKHALRSTSLLNLLVKHAEELATGTPETLRNIIIVAEGGGLTDAERQRFHRESARIFDYSSFSSKAAVGWNAYELCKLATQGLCPYCHQSYAFTIQRRKGGSGFRPTLDHFYPKSEYPYLALSLFNLVPACYVCNSTLKGAKDFYKSPHLHPLEDAEAIGFYFDVATYIDWRARGMAFRLDVRHTGDASSAQKAKNSIKTFLLDERYAPHLEEFEDFAERVSVWRPSMLQEFKRIFNVDSEEKILVGFDRSAYSKEMLGAVKRDIYDAFRRD